MLIVSHFLHKGRFEGFSSLSGRNPKRFYPCGVGAKKAP